MEVGRSNREIKVGFIIQARMKSTRLPGKILLPLPFRDGKPLIQWIIDKLKTSSFSHRIIVATSKLKYNDILVDYCKLNSIEYFRGSENNVLSRFISIAEAGDFNVVVRLTADNPIVDIVYLDKLIDFHYKLQNDYTHTEKMPIGMNLEVLSPSAIVSLKNETLSEYDKEHVTSFIIKNSNYKKSVFEIDLPQNIFNRRVTIDYPSDYLVVSALIDLSLKTGLSGIELINYTEKVHPWLFEINSTNFQKKYYASLKEEFTKGIELLKSFDLKRVAEILEKHET